MQQLLSKKGPAFCAGAAASLVLVLVSLVGCGSKALEPFNDADVSKQNTGPAEIINMPDGFSNVSTKCDHGNRIYVTYHGDAAYAAITVVANDPSCASTK